MSQTPTNPAALGDLFKQYLLRQAEAQSEGLGFADLMAEAELHDAVPVQPVDPKPAWADAQLAARLVGAPATTWTAPPDWPLLVATREPAQWLAFALGNFPQLVRDLQPLLRSEGRKPVGTPAPAALPDLLTWATRQTAGSETLLAAGVLRLAGHFALAALALASPVPSGWEAVQANERAALAWHQGDAEGALALWQAQPDSVPVRFNRGMAALFLGQTEYARQELQTVSRALPETSAWHHLAQLYLALAG